MKRDSVNRFMFYFFILSANIYVSVLNQQIIWKISNWHIKRSYWVQIKNKRKKKRIITWIQPSCETRLQSKIWNLRVSDEWYIHSPGSIVWHSSRQMNDLEFSWVASRQTRVRFLIFSYVIILICSFQSPYQSQTGCSIMPRVSSWLATKAILFNLVHSVSILLIF